MPEGPEVLRTTVDLKSRLMIDGRQLYLVNLLKFGNSYSDVDIELLRPALDQALLNIFCKGKEYYLIFADGKNGVIAIRGHHSMEGKWLFEHPENPKNVHFRIDFSSNLRSPEPEIFLYFYNTRFGQFDILVGADKISKTVNSLAGGFIGNFILTPEQWLINYTALGKDRLLRIVLMDQKELCSGIGNYLLAEILYEAKLHPEVKLNQLTYDEVVNLYHICFRIINGHYHKTLQKIIYQKKIAPSGYEISYIPVGKRKIWYVPVEQLPRI